MESVLIFMHAMHRAIIAWCSSASYAQEKKLTPNGYTRRCRLGANPPLREPILESESLLIQNQSKRLSSLRNILTGTPKF
jgi:hypothetical protein